MKKFCVNIVDTEAVLNRDSSVGAILVGTFDTKKEAVNFIRQYIDANVDDKGRICLISEQVFQRDCGMICPGSGIEQHTSDYNVLLGTVTCQHCKQKVKISAPNKLTGKVKIKKHTALLQEDVNGISMVFRPNNHPLLNDNLVCPNCGDESQTEHISLPAYPGDYFDCEACGQSFAPTQEQTNRMRCNGD